jgi:hypothetical protein
MQHRAIPPEAIKVSTDRANLSARCGVEISADLLARGTFLVSENCVFFLERLTSSVLEGHMVCAPGGRGREALEASRTALGYGFDMLGAAVIIGRVPVEDRAARLFTRWMGFHSDGVREREPNGPLVEWFEMRSGELH